MIQDSYKDWILLKELSGAYEFEGEFSSPEWLAIAHKVFANEMSESNFKEYLKERREANSITEEEQEDCLDIFCYLNDKKGYGDDEYIESILSAHPSRTFCLIYDDHKDNFMLYEKVN